MARNKNPEETVKLILEEALHLFVEKGYDNTSIQDIINNLGGLSKGAIYHHFPSKEAIFEAVCKKIAMANEELFTNIRDDRTKTGYEKLKAVFESAYSNPNGEAVVALTKKITSDPKFVMSEISELFEYVVPVFIQPIIEQGVKDGSIVTDSPKELAEVIMVLANIWINPAIVTVSYEELRQKLYFFQQLLLGLGLDIFNDDMIQKYAEFCKLYQR